MGVLVASASDGSQRGSIFFEKLSSKGVVFNPFENSIIYTAPKYLYARLAPELFHTSSFAEKRMFL